MRTSSWGVRFARTVGTLFLLLVAQRASGDVLAPIPGSPFEFPEGLNSNVVRLSPDERTLYVTNQNSDQVTVLDVAPNGVLSFVGVFGPTGSMPCGIVTSPDGSRVYVASAGAVDVFAVGSDRTLSPLQTVPMAGGGRNGIAYVSLVSGDFVYVSRNATPNAVEIFAVGGDGLLTSIGAAPTGADQSQGGYFGAPRLAVAAGRLYALNADSVTPLAIRPDGLLDVLSDPVAATGAFGVAAAPDGSAIYVTKLDAVSQFHVNADGSLRWDRTTALGFDGDSRGPNGVVVHPSGSHLIVTHPYLRRFAVLALPSMQHVIGSPVSPGYGGAGLEMNRAGTLLFGGRGVGTFTAVTVSSFEADGGGHYVTVFPDGTGTGGVVSDVPGLSCPTDCSAQFAPGALLGLAATAAPGSRFEAWGGDCAGESPTCTLTVDGPKNVIARFALESSTRYRLTVTPSGTGVGTVMGGGLSCTKGSTVGCAVDVGYGSTVTLTAAAAAGSTFGGWSGSGCSGTGSCTVTMSGARYVTATFTATNFELSATARSKDGGLGTVTGNGLSCRPGSTSGCASSVANGTTVSLSSIPDAGSIFKGWTGACGGTGPCSFKMDGARAVYASFEPATYRLGVTASSVSGGTGTVSGGPVACSTGSSTGCSGDVENGATVTLTATATGGSVFGGWSGGGCSGTGTCVVSMTGAKSVTASFHPGTYRLTLTPSGTGMGTVTGGGLSCTKGSSDGCAVDVPYGTSVTLSASAGANSAFTGWSGSGCSGTGTCVVTVSTQRYVTATFAPTVHLTVATSGTGRGTVAGDGISCATGDSSGCSVVLPQLHPAATRTLVPTPALGSTFVGWSGACTGTGPCVVTMDASKTVTASFENAAPEITSFAVSPAIVTQGQAATISWSTRHAASVSITPTLAAVAPSSSVNVVPAATTTYTLVATSAAGVSVTATATVTVVPAPEILAFSASPSTVVAGQQTVLSWSTAGAATISISPDVGDVTGANSTAVSPARSTVYRLAAANAAGSVVASDLTVSVATPEPLFSPPPGRYTSCQAVSITSAAAGAVIHYTLDGSTPTASSSRYVAPVTLCESARVRAIAYAPDMQPSVITGGAYEVPSIFFPDGFNGTGIQLNGARYDAGSIKLTDPSWYNAATSAFFSVPVKVTGFSTTFYYAASGGADGATFVLQRGGPGASGMPGVGLGYGGMPNSVAIKLDLYNNAGEGTSSTGVFTNGAMPTVPSFDLGASGIQLASARWIGVRLEYGSGNLLITIWDPALGRSFQRSVAVDIPQTIGGATAWAGFTGGTGAITANQWVRNWTYYVVP